MRRIDRWIGRHFTGMLMVCSDWTDNRRSLDFADARREGEVDDATASASQQRIAQFLDTLPRNDVVKLSDTDRVC